MTSKEPLNFQSIIMTLQEFWAEQGCMIWQPYYSQVGAGTMNPATSLRVLGPEPWRVGYVEPSIRPDDGRYGENPNRMQMHYQFQVILKPDPGNPQEIYLQSLEALGIDPRQHDIRFVEDNWESPALGAWGLGWEVWLDGQEITQFTYFQQAGGIQLDPVSVEITYGLERIAIALQQVNSFRDIQWSPTRTDGDVNLQAEQEHSRYYFEIADVDRLRQMYALFEAEAEACLAQKLVLPAHDYILKCSHTFNVLDTRGAIGVTERQALFGRMRDLSRRVAESYLEQRQRLEYPWLDETGETSQAHLTPAAASQVLSTGVGIPLPISTPAPLLVEIGTEDLPAGDLDAALDQLRARVPALLSDLRLEHGAVRILGTPRRLVIHVEDLTPGQPDLEQVIKGPPAERTFNPDGSPTQAALGFARSKGIDISELHLRDLDGGRYATAVVRQAGRPTPDVLSEALPGLLAGLRFDKTMRWNASNIGFSRPIRWLLAVYGTGQACQVVPFEYAGVYSGNTTRGLRFQSPQQTAVKSPEGYFQFLSDNGILLDPAERKQTILAQVEALAAQVGGVVPDDPGLLSEVTNLVETPTAVRGTFEAAYIKLPREVLVSVMKKHQRYFPVTNAAGDLLPYFIAVRNGDDFGVETVIDGNQHVIRARFADANYFVREDLKQPLESYLPKLGTLAFQYKLGSMLDKTARITALADDLSHRLNLNPAEAAATHRAAELSKADLATQMVVEMTSLQGYMGRGYALQSGESPEVALAIFEHYLPRFSGDDVPQSRPGLVVGLADRLDTLSGLFAAGLAPSGSKDPYAQRRVALGLVQNLVVWELDFDLASALSMAGSHLPIQSSAESQAAVLEFIVERLRNVLLEQNWRYDIVDAILAVQGANPALASRAVKELGGWVSRSDWNTILPAYARCVRITRDFKEQFVVDPDSLMEIAEQDLLAACTQAENAPRALGSVADFLNAFVPIIPAVNQFFDNVLVMAEDERLRRNRLGLLQRIAALAADVAELSRLEGF